MRSQILSKLIFASCVYTAWGAYVCVLDISLPHFVRQQVYSPLRHSVCLPLRGFAATPWVCRQSVRLFFLPPLRHPITALFSCSVCRSTDLLRSAVCLSVCLSVRRSVFYARARNTHAKAERLLASNNPSKFKVHTLFSVAPGKIEGSAPSAGSNGGAGGGGAPLPPPPVRTNT